MTSFLNNTGNECGFNPPPPKTMRKCEEEVERLQPAQVKAVHDKWFREQVAEALQEADDPSTVWIAHDIVKADMQRQREALLARIG